MTYIVSSGALNSTHSLVYQAGRIDKGVYKGFILSQTWAIHVEESSQLQIDCEIAMDVNFL